MTYNKKIVLCNIAKSMMSQGNSAHIQLPANIAQQLPLHVIWFSDLWPLGKSVNFVRAVSLRTSY